MEWLRNRRGYVTSGVVSVAVAVVAVLALWWGRAQVSAVLPASTGLPSVAQIASAADGGSVLWNVLYLLTDFAEGPFLCDVFVAAGMFVGAAANIVVARRTSGTRGYWGLGTSVWAWLVVSQGLAMLLANLFWRFVVGWHGWFPSFAPLVSVTPIAVLYFGTPTAKKAATGIVLGAILPVFVVQMLITYFATPLGLPTFAGIGLGISSSSALTTELFRRLPWMSEEPSGDGSHDGGRGRRQRRAPCRRRCRVPYGRRHRSPCRRRRRVPYGTASVLSHVAAVMGR